MAKIFVCLDVSDYKSHEEIPPTCDTNVDENNLLNVSVISSTHIFLLDKFCCSVTVELRKDKTI